MMPILRRRAAPRSPQPPCWCIEWPAPPNPRGIHTVVQMHPDCPRGCWGEHRSPVAAEKVRIAMRKAQAEAREQERPDRGTESWRGIYMTRLWNETWGRAA